MFLNINSVYFLLLSLLLSELSDSGTSFDAATSGNSFDADTSDGTLEAVTVVVFSSDEASSIEGLTVSESSGDAADSAASSWAMLI